MPIQDALLLILLAAGLGMGIGYGLSVHLASLRTPRAPTAAEDLQAERSQADVAAAVPRPPRTAPRAVPTPLLPPAADLLLVDDSAVARVKLRRLFEAAGYQVHLASDGVEALALLDKGRYGLLVTDLEMPNMDGVTLINACLGRQQNAGMPMLAITGHESLRVKFNECRDISGIHRKPWVDDILLSHVATLIGARPARAQTPVQAAVTAG